MASAPEHSRTMMKRFLSTCVEANLVPETDCDVIMQQFADFIDTAAKSELENFSVENDRLDTFLQNSIAIRYPKVWLVVEMALLLSHGQATVDVERGFSINKELVVENQQEQSLVARRVIKDHILHVIALKQTKCQLKQHCTMYSVHSYLTWTEEYCFFHKL